MKGLSQLLFEAMFYLDKILSLGKTGIPVNITGVKAGRYVVGYCYAFADKRFPASAFFGKLTAPGTVYPAYLLTSRTWIKATLLPDSIVTQYVFYRTAWAAALDHQKRYTPRMFK